jgi:ketosteroid isomerase-like protein
MARMRRIFAAVAIAALTFEAYARGQARGYDDLVALFTEFTAFERPAMNQGAPDYTAAAVAARQARLKTFQSRLAAIDPKSWPVEQQVDHALVRALMNGMDFDLRVLRPWARDPAFYQSLWTAQSDTPAHEGPTHHAAVELWTYAFPLSATDEARLARELRTIPPLLAQARVNLVGNAKDLWITGTGTMTEQMADLDELSTRAAAAGADLKAAILSARTATAGFVEWLERQAGSKTGPSGVGKEHYTWSLRNVQLVPMTWDDEVALLKRELARAHASLKLEEERNRGLPQLTAAADAEQYRQRASAAVTKYIAFLKRKDLLTVQDYLDPAMREHLGGFVPLERRNFFGIASHYEPMTLFAHWYHWFDHAWMKRMPHASAIRRGALPFNIWSVRAEGMATAMEEIILHAGYYDDNPRAREIVWIMLAQRCARGLASLYAQANEFDIKQAKAFQVEWTPRGWMRPDLDLLNFEQQLYLRQPGYGTSYVTGKYLIDDLIKDRARQLGDGFTMRRFFDEFNAAGVIPVPLIRWQMTGQRP